MPPEVFLQPEDDWPDLSRIEHPERWGGSSGRRQPDGMQWMVWVAAACGSLHVQVCLAPPIATCDQWHLLKHMHGQTPQDRASACNGEFNCISETPIGDITVS